MAGGRLFQTRGPATANALSPSDVVVQGMSVCLLARLLNNACMDLDEWIWTDVGTWTN